MVKWFTKELCEAGEALCDFNPTNISNPFHNVSSPSMLEFTASDFLDLMDLPNTYDKLFDIDECVFPNFYCDTVNTTYYCNPEKEREWLEDFYFATNGDSWKDSTNWLSNNVSHCDGWFGVRCCDKIVQFNHTTNSTYYTHLNHSCLNTIQLDDNQINGTLPNEWFNSTIFTIFSARGTLSNFPNDTNNTGTFLKYGLHGTIPRFKYNLPNMAYIHLPYNKLTGTIPEFGDAHCTLSYDLHTNYFNSTIPNWENEVFLGGMELEANVDIYGTLPNWDKLIWPFKYTIYGGTGTNFHGYTSPDHYSLTGTIPNFNKNMCPAMYHLQMNNNKLIGSLPNVLPKTFCFWIENHRITYNISNSALMTMQLNDNQLNGSVPFQKLAKRVNSISLQSNQFSGIVDFSDKYNSTTNSSHINHDNNEITYLSIVSLNISDNQFEGTFPCMKDNPNLIYVDIRFNSFKKIEEYCRWPNKTIFFLASHNLELEQSYDSITKYFPSMGALTLDLTNVYGSVPRNSSVLYNGGLYLSYYDTDMDGYLTQICPHCDWNYSWVILGLNMYEPLQPYVSKQERGLQMILIPSYELWVNLVTPCCLIFVACGIYIAIYGIRYKITFKDYMNDTKDNEYFSSANDSGKNLLHNRPAFCQSLTGDEKEFVKLSYEFHKIMIISHKFLFSLTIISGVLMGIYYMGNNWTKNRYNSLKISVTYVGSHEHTVSDELWVGIAVAGFMIYSWICCYYSFKITTQCNYVSIKSYQMKDGSYWRGGSNPTRSSNVTLEDESIEDEANLLSIKHAIGNNNDTEDIFPIESPNPSIRPNPGARGCARIFGCCLGMINTLARSIMFVIALIAFIAILLLPIRLYNLYQSLPTENTLPIISNILNINNNYRSLMLFMIKEFTSLIIAIQQWFLITPFVSFLIYLFPSKRVIKWIKRKIAIKYLFIQMWRNITFIVLPLLILLIFDDKCYQNWKHFWPYCDSNDAAFEEKGECVYLTSSFAISRQKRQTYVCFFLCKQIIVAHRCVRQIFQVLGPLYTIKATFGMFFPLLKHLQLHIKHNVDCDLCNCKQKRKRNGKKTNKTKNKRKNKNKNKKHCLEIEYIGLISNLEIVIVFGWAVPILVFLYNIVLFGYGLVYYYWLFNGDLIYGSRKNVFSIKQVAYMQTVGKWLFISVIVQQCLAFIFFAYSQEYIEYAAAIGSNFVLILIVCSIAIVKRSSNYQNDFNHLHVGAKPQRKIKIARDRRTAETGTSSSDFLALPNDKM